MVWACTENGRKQNSQKSIIYEFESKKAEIDQEIDGKMEVREDGRTVSGEGWQEQVQNREEWKKLLRMARNRLILHVPVE